MKIWNLLIITAFTASISAAQKPLLSASDTQQDSLDSICLEQSVDSFRKSGKTLDKRNKGPSKINKTTEVNIRTDSKKNVASTVDAASHVNKNQRIKGARTGAYIANEINENQQDEQNSCSCPEGCTCSCICE